MALPARVRENLQQVSSGKLVLTIDMHDKCLLLYPPHEWDKVEAKVAGLDNARPQIRTMQRLLLGYATPLELDGQGRVLIPGPLRDHAELDKKLVLLGQGNKVEIWNESRWNESLDDWFENDQNKSIDDLDELSGFSL